ncbi:MAG: hypothetical protein V7K64_19035 [Nostoc sp.]|uniref:hypothetical protein n=1 Tax=unclassified Nostoc TaxID=2593658 RepID=UPI001D617243|nr:hypothetical protein [Nostoc sp. JL34]MBN3882124.1 hypothetical protein [Nostoc sp. JL34]
MARRLSAAELQARADKAKAREAERRQNLISNPKAYKPQAADDYDTAYYRDPLEAGLILAVTVKKEAYTKLGGLTSVGLLATVPENAVSIPKVRGDKRKLITVSWFFGDDTPIVVPATATRNRYVKFYDKNGNQSHYSIPFSVATGAFTLSTIITNFGTLFNKTNGTKREVLGAHGEVFLKFGKEVIARF